MKRLLTDKRVWGLPADSAAPSRIPVSPSDLMKPISNGLAHATDCFLLYFSGHGFLDDQGELCLAIYGSDGENSYSGVPYQWVRRELLKSRPRRTLVIIDCCYSGLAGRTLDGGASLVSDVVVEGAYVMTSVAENKRALSVPGDEYTAFTGELISILGNGMSTDTPTLPIDEIYKAVYRNLASKGRPRPKAYEGDTGGLIAFRNRACELTAATSDLDSQAELLDAPRPLIPAPPAQIPGTRSIGRFQWRPAAGADTPFALRLNSAARNLSLEVYSGIAADVRALADGGCLDLEWDVAPSRLMGKWQDIRRPYRSNGVVPTAAPTAVTGIDISGGTNDILSIIDMVPSRRLAFLGKAGSGKSTVLKLACSDMIAYGHGSWPVPAPLDMITWNPSRESLDHWVDVALQKRYISARGRVERGLSLSRALVETGKILLVLDNFDEMSPVNRIAALNEFKASPMPFLLASRLSEFEDAVSRGALPSDTAAVILRDLDVSQVRDYVARLAEKDQSRSQGWKEVAAHLGSPGSGAADPLRAALSTPRMIELLKTTYVTRESTNPAELLNGREFPDSESIERSLLAGAFGGAADSFTVGIARYLERESATRVGWWQVSGTGKLSGVLLPGGLAGIISLICAWVWSFIYWPSSYSWAFGGAVAVTAALATG